MVSPTWLMPSRPREPEYVSLDEILDRQPEQLPHGVVDARPGPEKIFAAPQLWELSYIQAIHPDAEPGASHQGRKYFLTFFAVEVT